jgi:4-hydroxybenzoyl-CoA thioesterase
VAALTNTRIVRIEWGDCDPAGIIFYPRYFEIFDNSTTALFEAALGMKKIKFLQAYEFLGYPLVDTRATFLKPTRFGDDVTVHSSVEFGTSSFTITHRISLDGDTCAECTEKRVWAVRDPANPQRIKSRPVPEAVLAKFN